jgi:hypothetical protein
MMNEEGERMVGKKLTPTSPLLEVYNGLVKSSNQHAKDIGRQVISVDAETDDEIRIHQTC